MKLKKESKQRIKEIDKMIRNLHAEPEIFSYVKLYQALQELHFWRRYKLVCMVCDAILRYTETEKDT